MFNENNGLMEFGEFRLDTHNRTLWHRGKPVAMPLKELDVLCMLLEHPGELVTKNEIIEKVWQNTFVEESNLSRHIYLLRKTFKRLGQKGDLIQNIPRRGYRFSGEVREVPRTEVVVEKRTQVRTLIEVEDAVSVKQTKPARSIGFSFPIIAGAAVLLLLTSAFLGYRYLLPQFSPQPIRSIAVLPFKTIGDADAHHGLGLADLLVTRLSMVKDINVRPTSAILAFEDQNVESAAAGKKLNVDAVLEGTMYREGNSVRITTRLVRVADSSTLWSGEYEADSSQELRLQTELVLQIAEGLKFTLTTDQKRMLAHPFTRNTDAYKLYVSGRYEWNKRDWGGMVEAQRLFRNAIEKDPSFALAYVGLADTTATSGSAEAFAAAEKALELDPNLAEAHASMGFLLMFHKWDWDAAENEFKRSIELNPGYASAYQWYATLLAIRGRNAEAKERLRRALEIDPNSHNLLADMGQLHYFAREYSEAEMYCRKALEIRPDFLFAHEYLADIYLQVGEFDKAMQADADAIRINESILNSSIEGTRRQEAKMSGLRAAFVQNGFNGYLRQKVSYSGTDPHSQLANAMTYSFLGDKTSALDNLERAVDQKAFLSVFVKTDPVFDGIRSEPRFHDVLRKMNLLE